MLIFNVTLLKLDQLWWQIF